jgi:uncharacterized low-complexity protein
MAPKRARAKSAAAVADTKRRPQTLAQKVTKCLYDNCKGMTEEMKEVKSINGKTLRQGVHDELAKMEKAGVEGKIGALRWRELKAPYQQSMDMQTTLHIAHADMQPVAPLMLKGVLAAKDKFKPDRSILVSYLPTAPRANRTGVIGLYKLGLSLNPRCHKQLSLCQAIVRYIAHAALKEAFADETACMLAWVDLVLCHSRKVSGLKADAFCKIWGKVLELRMSS